MKNTHNRPENTNMTTHANNEKTIVRHIEDWFKSFESEQFLDKSKAFAIDSINAAFNAMKGAFGVTGAVAVYMMVAAPTIFSIGLIAPSIMGLLPTVFAASWLFFAVIKYIQINRERTMFDSFISSLTA